MTAVNPNRLSVAILARDVADPLRFTLASVRDIADEIVVADTGSSDGTVKVAAEFGARIVPLAWENDFSAARNAVQNTAQGEWILWLDAGETLSEEDAVSLKEFVLLHADVRHAYLLAVRLPPPDAASSAEQVAKPRLLPRNPKIEFAGRVCESPLASLERAGVSLLGLPFVVRRSTRDLENRLKKQRAQRNLAIADLEIQERGTSTRLLNCLGDALLTLGENQRAVESFRSALALAEPGSVAALEAYYGLLTALGSTDLEREVQLQECIQALEIFPVDAQLLCALGGYLQARGKLELAGQAYLTAFKFGQVTPTLWHLAEIRDIAAVCYSLTLQLRDQLDAAVRFLEDSLAERPDAVRLRRRLIEIFVQQGAKDSALAHVGALPKNTPHLDALRSAVRGACFAAQKNLIAAKAYLNAGYDHGCRDPLCLKWLALCLISTNEIAKARQVLLEWQRLEPRNVDIQKLLERIPGQQPTATPGTMLRIDPSNSDLSKPAGPITLSLPSWSAPRS